MSKTCHKCNAPLVETANFCTSCGASVLGISSSKEDDLYIGQLIAGNFEVRERIGVGSMGVVYLAEQVSLKKKVALKILKGSAAQSQEAIQRFQREARAASRLNHPNSISIIDFGQDEDGAPFIAMEYLDGRDLGQILSEELPLDPERILQLLIQVCSALDEAHAAGIIHRDLKPANIVVSKRRSGEEFVKVLDFGIAKLNDPDATGGPHLTQDGLVCGTPAFMSPEQIKGMELDPRTDIYALGVVLFMLLTGRLPFQANSSAGMAAKIITETPPRVSKVRLDLKVPELFDPIVERAMSKSREDRYESALTLRSALEDALQSLKAPPAPVGGPQVILPAPPPPNHGLRPPGAPAPGPPHLRQQPGALMAANLKAAEARLTGAQGAVKPKGKKPPPDASLATRVDMPAMPDDEPVRVSRGAGFYIGIFVVIALLGGGIAAAVWYVQSNPEAIALLTASPGTPDKPDTKALLTARGQASYYVKLAMIRAESPPAEEAEVAPPSSAEPPASAEPAASAPEPDKREPARNASAPAEAVDPPASAAEPPPTEEKPARGNADASYKQGQDLMASNPQEALRHFERATQLNPRHRNAWLSIHRLAVRLGNDGKARQACLKVIAMSPREDFARSSCERWLKRSGN